MKVLTDKTSKHRWSSCAQAGPPDPPESIHVHALLCVQDPSLTQPLSLSLSPTPYRSLPTPCSSNRIPGACKFASGRGSRTEGPPSSPDGETAGETLRLRRIKRAATAAPPLSSPQDTFSLLLPHQPQQADGVFFPSQIPRRPAAPALPLAVPPHTLLPPPTHGSHLALLTPRGGRHTALTESRFVSRVELCDFAFQLFLRRNEETEIGVLSRWSVGRGSLDFMLIDSNQKVLGEKDARANAGGSDLVPGIPVRRSRRSTSGRG